MLFATGRTRAHGKTRKRFNHERLIFLLDWIGLLEIRGQSLQRRSGRGGRHARLQPADDHELPASAIIELPLVLGLEIVRDLIVNPERQPDLRRENLRRAGESLRENPDHGEGAAVDRDRRAQHRGIEPFPLPIVVAHDRDRRVAAGCFLFRPEGAALHRHHSHDREIIGAHHVGERATRAAFIAHADHGEVVRHHPGEDAVLIADIDVGRIGKTAKRLRIFLILRKDLHDLVRLRVMGRLEQQRVHEAEDGGVRANPEREHNDRRRRESPCLHELPKCKSEVVKHTSMMPRGSDLDSNDFSWQSFSKRRIWRNSQVTYSFPVPGRTRRASVASASRGNGYRP